VVTKIAASLDGRTAMADGESRWITSEASRRDVHRIRAGVSAILTGSRTVREDDPALTARLDGVVRQPMRVLVDGTLQVPPSMRLFEETAQVVVATAVDPARLRHGPHVDVIRLDAGHANVDLERLMHHLAEREINELLVEAGPSLNGTLLKYGLVDEIVLYMAPQCLGNDAQGMFDLPFVKNLDQRLELDIEDIRRVGPDLKVTALIRKQD
jgi:diaminohydroxyphosphoribosylaminopyrimidine deaminase/5-amino-6-(5-phosphoribosylamino)uracil reductase